MASSTLNPLGRLGRAMEGKYFKDEQESAVMRRREWLKKEGTLEKYGQEALAARRKAAPLLSHNVLTEILGHSVRFAPKRDLDKLRDIDNKIYQKEHGRGAARRRSLLPRTYALGTQISLGRSKYVSLSLFVCAGATRAWERCAALQTRYVCNVRC